jgi:four helix bundle protein
LELGAWRENDAIRFETMPHAGILAVQCGMQDFRNLRVWQASHQLRLGIYRLTRDFPTDERFGLTAQVRRSACSIATNIAESCGYRGGRESARFLYIANGSRAETLDHLITARDLGYLTVDAYSPLEDNLDAIRRLLVGLLRSIATDVPATRPVTSKRQAPSSKRG